jgi:superfamily II DNA or RNA helicase
LIVKIDSMLRLQEVSPRVLEQVKAELTIKNPDHVKKKAMGLSRWAWGPEYVKLWSEKDINGKKEYILPRGYYARLLEILGGWVPVKDNRIVLQPVKFPKKPELRDYQLPAIQKAKDWQQGVIIMPCGSGKTECADGIVAELRQPTLWITHTMDLLKQSMDRAVSRLGLTGRQIGIIQGENMSIGTHMTFATVQTLAKRDLSEIKNMFGCVIVDESHLCFKDDAKSRMFADVISQFPAYYRFGMTASEYRSDGLIETMFHIIGPKIYEVAQDDPRLMTMMPRVEFIETDFEYAPEEGEMLNVQQMISEMKYDSGRDSILKMVLEMAIGGCCLVLGDSLDHLRILKEYTELFLGQKAAFVCGETPKKEREKIMADMRAGKYQYLFATYQLAKLGLDIPRLNLLVLATPKRDKTSVQQAVGRIMRPFEGKGQPVVYDIWDSKVPQLRYWARERVKVYRSLGCEIVGGPRVRK